MQCVYVLSMGVLASVLPARAGTKTERAPPLSQVPSIMTAKVIDYTPHWADTASVKSAAQRRKGWEKSR